MLVSIFRLRKHTGESGSFRKGGHHEMEQRDLIPMIRQAALFEVRRGKGEPLPRVDGELVDNTSRRDE